MKFIIITIALLTAPSLVSSEETGHILAMGTKGDAVHSQDRGAEKRYSERDNEGKRTGKDLISEESSARKRGPTLPEKKPRLKYRDGPKCSC